MRVYLAGGINGLSDEDAKGWRTRAKSLLSGCEILDPMSRDYRGIEGQNGVEEIVVRGDKRDIMNCDAVVAMCLNPSWGTAMEIHFAHTIEKPVFSVCRQNVSPWLRFHTRVFHSLEDACQAMKTEFGL